MSAWHHQDRRRTHHAPEPGRRKWDVAQLTYEVILAVEEKGRPADEILREFFRELAREAQGSCLPSEAVAKAVFDFYRWRGWTKPVEGLEKAINRTADLASRFAADPGAIPDFELAANAFPEWLKSEMEITPAFAVSLQRSPTLWLRVRKGKGAEIAASLGQCKPLGTGALADVLEYHGQADIFKTIYFREGDVQIQDASSQGVGFLCDPSPGETWWDVCAGEGGKTMHLSDLMGNKGLIWASDRAEWRLKKLRARAARSKVFNYRAVQWSGEGKLPTRTRFDGVLVDAPCSGVGTWGRNPHARWTTSPRDVKELAELQLRLLSNASGAVKPGGRLVYSVCTLTRSETNDVADAFEKAHADFRPLKLPDPLRPGKQDQERHAFMPQDFGANGMFVAVWSRR